MEVSSHSLDQNRAKGLSFDVAIFSNISHDHLDYHLTMENYFLAKAKLFQNDSLKKAVINIDDEYGLRLCEMTDAKIVTVSLKDKNADIHIHKKSISATYTSFELWLNGKFIGEYQTKLIGEFNLMNLGLSLGAVDNIDNVLKNIQNIDAVKGRMERITLKNGVSIIIDYAHTPDALEKVLQTLQEYKQNKLWCMFGCGGNRDTTKRAIMANIAEQNSDIVVVTEDNSRLENVDDIFVDIKHGFENEQMFIQSREKAIKYIIKNAKIGDIVLLAGKGHECYMDTNGQKRHFDEREIIAKYGDVI
jgi:UDP-N-acetylmuramoyl-L-alanyl-D-glutamate--2,6-diaminopimelate ligase